MPTAVRRVSAHPPALCVPCHSFFSVRAGRSGLGPGMRRGARSRPRDTPTLPLPQRHVSRPQKHATTHLGAFSSLLQGWGSRGDAAHDGAATAPRQPAPCASDPGSDLLDLPRRIPDVADGNRRRPGPPVRGGSPAAESVEGGACAGIAAERDFNGAPSVHLGGDPGDEIESPGALAV